jgi:hypothetical protein
VALDSWARTLASVLLRSIAGDEGTALVRGTRRPRSALASPQ